MNDKKLGSAPPSEPLEGLDNTGSDGWGEYPLDSVFVRTEIRTVGETVKRIQAGRYIMDPDFQRSFVWPEDKQSKLVESCVMRIPLPVFYVAEASDGKIIIVDGLQRLTTFVRFLSDELTLKSLGVREGEDPKLHPLNGKKFSGLPISLQERIQDTQITLYILDAHAPERARLDIFDRVNSGVPLSRQQMRNALYSGAATEWLKDAAKSKLFLQATGATLDSKTMRDREAINRFCAFDLLEWSLYTNGDMDGYLGQALKLMNSKPATFLQSVRQLFDKSMRNNYTLFGRHAFRKSILGLQGTDHERHARSVINIALFDVCSVNLSRVDESLVQAHKPAILNGVFSLLADPGFVDSITYSTNSTRQVHGRFQHFGKMLSEAIA
ncbi:MAG: DUF262 domain-containing protein [Micropepsaceae bacterium]